MASLAAARSAVRSSARGSRLAVGAVRSTSPSSPIRVIPNTTFRSPMAMARRLGSMLPYHTATASSLLNSMISVSNRNYLWTNLDGP